VFHACIGVTASSARVDGTAAEQVDDPDDTHGR
jgi:hypothetical protein